MQKDKESKIKEKDNICLSARQGQDFSWLDLAKSILYLVGKDKKKYIFWNILRFVTYFYVIIPPFILGKTVDFFTKYRLGDSLNIFYGYVIFVTIFGLILLLSRITTKKKLIYIRNAVYRNIRIKGFENLANLDFQRTQNSSVGVKTQKIENGMSSLHSVMAILENDIFKTVAIFTGVITVFFFLQPVYVVFFLAYCVMLFFILRAYYKKIQFYSYKRNLAKEKATSIFIEGLNNLLTLKVFNSESTFGQLLKQREKVSENAGNDEISIILSQWHWFYFLNSLAMGGFLLLIGLNVVNQIISVGMIVILYSYIDRLITNAHNVIGLYQDFLGAKNGIARMMPIFWEDKKEIGGKSSFPGRWESVELKNVKFTYKKEEQDKFHTGVKSIDLRIKKNTKIGFVGKTGSGKSTLAKLLIGLYRIDLGEYLIGNEKFSNIKTDELLKNVSIVLQESEMFNLSLKENITLMHKFDKELFKKAIRIAQLEEVIDKMPKGVKTFIGEKGYHLSGGERQRVGIARAIYRNTQIMIFDEATSSLDSRTEKLIQEGIEREMEQKTLIFIAHRITTLKNVDNIYVFKNGRIVEDGKYDELLSRKEGEFYKLFKK